MSDPEDILNDALTFLGEKQVVDTDILYGPLQLTTAPKVKFLQIASHRCAND